VYVVAGGGFMVHGNGRVDGRGVALYNTLDPLRGEGVGGYDQIVLAESAAIALSAPSRDAYRGIAIFQDRSNPLPLEIGGALDALDGVIYAPSAELRVRGATARVRADLVVGRLTTQGSFTLFPPTQILSGG
ncbi:MAG: hypothetical protein ACREQ9_27645, partial [Candidatus Binatia bacterium]